MFSSQLNLRRRLSIENELAGKMIYSYCFVGDISSTLLYKF